MRYISILFICSSCYLTDYISPYGSSNNSDKPKKRVYIISGQSNAGRYSTGELGIVDSVMCWNYFSKTFEPFVDVSNQLYGNVGGVIVPLAKNLRKKYPKDSIYFVQFHRPNTDLAFYWNIHSNKLFKTLVNTLDLSIKSVGNYDYIYFIWIQGERDCRNLLYANDYAKNEINLFDSLKTKYRITQFINYNIPSTLPKEYAYKMTVRAAKQSNQWVKVIESNGMDFQTDKVHLTPDIGIKQLADSISTFL